MLSTKGILLITLCGVCMGLPLQPEPDNEPETTVLGKRQGQDLNSAETFGINVYTNPLGAGGLYGASSSLLNPYSYGLGGGLGGLGGLGSYGSSYGSGLGGAVATYGLGGAGYGGSLQGGYGAATLGGLGGYGGGIGGLGGYGGGIGGYGGGLSTYGAGIGGLGGLGGIGGGLGGLGGGLGGIGGGLGGIGGGLGGLGGYSGATRKSLIKGKLIRLLQKLGSGGQVEYPGSGVGIGVGSLGGLGGVGAGSSFGGGGGLDSIQAAEMIRNQLPYGMYGSVLTGNQYGFGFGNNFGLAGAGLGSRLYQQPSTVLEVTKRRIFDSVGSYVASRIPNILDRLFLLREMEDDDYDD